MLTIRKILLPVDFSAPSLAAAKHAAALARQFDSTLVFAHVIPSASFEYAGFEGDVETKLRGRLEELAAASSSDRAIEPLVLEGDPAEEIVKLANKKQVDLIVMPTHGYGPFRRFVLGSVTAWVLRHSDCPVLTGAHWTEQPYRVVCCAVELTGHSEKVLRWAADFAGSCGAGLEVVHAALPDDLCPHIEEYIEASWQQALLRSARQETEKLVRKVGCRAEVYAGIADASDCITKAVAAAHANLLVVGRSLKEGLRGLFHTNAYELIREAPCPVVSV